MPAPEQHIAGGPDIGSILARQKEQGIIPGAAADPPGQTTSVNRAGPIPNYPSVAPAMGIAAPAAIGSHAVSGSHGGSAGTGGGAAGGGRG